MGQNRGTFCAKDIGAELLPIITKGLYRDPLDALREYIQNAIDAKASRIEIDISSDVVVVTDNGVGMNPAAAKLAIRLGMSAKNPAEDVGFRGIGVYSAYNICDRLEIYTQASSSKASMLMFDFLAIRRFLEKEEQRRKVGKPPELYLEKLLSNSVRVDEPETNPLRRHGTMVMMIGLRGEVYERFTDPEKVKKYLESVVPLPFRRDFQYKQLIETELQKKEYRVVDLYLRTGTSKEQLYRPYFDEMFTHNEGYKPRFYELKHELGKGKLGFAWVCINDARRYLPVKDLRGLLIKKFDFSVGDRRHFSQYFSRAVFNNRISGEVIITSDDLIPNAARTEFEPSSIRDSLYVAFGKLAEKISSEAETIQNELKAKEELESISINVFAIVKKISELERDIPHLLLLNTKLTSYQRTLNSYKKILTRLKKDLYAKTSEALNEALNQITEVLQARKKAKGRPSRIDRAKRVRQKAPTQDEVTYAEDKLRSLQDVLATIDLEVNEITRSLLEYLDDEYFRPKMTELEYDAFLDDLRTYLEGII